MGIHYVDVFRTYVRSYKVEADSKEEAESLVAQEDPSIADNYEEELSKIRSTFYRSVQSNSGATLCIQNNGVKRMITPKIRKNKFKLFIQKLRRLFNGFKN